MNLFIIALIKMNFSFLNSLTISSKHFLEPPRGVQNTFKIKGFLNLLTFQNSKQTVFLVFKSHRKESFHL